MTEQYVWLAGRSMIPHEEVAAVVFTSDAGGHLRHEVHLKSSDTRVIAKQPPRCVPLSDTLTIESFLAGED